MKFSRFISSSVLLIVTAVANPFQVEAALVLPRIFGDNMVIQCEQAIPIWGLCSLGEAVSITFSGKTYETLANAEGKWKLSLDAHDASWEPHELIIEAGNDRIVFKNILLGEVWLCSGQSNMEMPVAKGWRPNSPVIRTDPQLAKDVKGPGFPEIRLFRVEKVIQEGDLVSGGWLDCQGEALARFSAIGYIFAREIQETLDVPVGMIQSAWGATRIETWTPIEAYLQHPVFSKDLVGKPLKLDGNTPGSRYEALIKPLIPYAIKGVLWYQGEGNITHCNDGLRYADKMQALISSWRSAWNNPRLPFYYVQLAPYAYSERTQDALVHARTELPELWEAQEAVLEIPHTGMVPTIDLVDDFRNIHPQQKRPVAERLAQLVLAQAYNRKEFHPDISFFDKMEIIGNKALISFSKNGGELRCKNDQPLTAFEIAGKDGQFKRAIAEISGKKQIMVYSPDVTSPQMVRFAWDEQAQPNLVNEYGWPVYPFRSNSAIRTRSH